MSERTLQRRLEAEATSFVQLLDDTRRELAEQYLGRLHLSLAQAAYLLGFAAGSQDANPEDVEKLAAKAQRLAEQWDRPPNAPDPVDITDEVPDDSTVDHSADAYDD